jgi:uncharacterized protein YbaP (TraB family)
MTVARSFAAGLVGVGLAVGCVAGYGQGEPPKVETMAPAAQTAPAAAAKPAAGEVQATPAMWMVKGVHGTVYLFGSVHVMKPGVRWETPKVETAFKQSGVLYTEIADAGEDAMKAMQPMVLSLGMDTEHPLSTKISKEDAAALDAALKKMGAPGEAAVDGMQPWLVYLSLSVLPAVQAGYDLASGIDRVLQTEAKAAGKPVKGFETAEEQLHYIADFPQAEQVALLHETLEELPSSVEKTNEMVVDWEQGKVEKIAAMENDDLKAKHPELYAKLLVNRNEKMAETIAGMLKDPATGTVFVAVGAAHLAGPDSIQKMLEKSGFVAVREE